RVRGGRVGQAVGAPEPPPDSAFAHQGCACGRGGRERMVARREGRRRGHSRRDHRRHVLRERAARVLRHAQARTHDRRRPRQARELRRADPPGARSRRCREAHHRRHQQPGLTMTVHIADPDHNSSFTKGIFLGEIREALVFPFPELSKDEKESLSAIVGSFRSWAKDNVDSAKHDHDGKFPENVITGMAELGLMGLNIPEEYGGFGANAMTFNRIFGEVGGTDGALAVYFGAHLSIGSKGITLFGTDDQKKRWLPKCATGELVAAFCLTEPGSGSDAQAMRTTAVPSADGKSYTLNGQKIWISNAGYAGVLTVFAKVPVEIDGKPKQRVTAFIVDAHASGVSLGKIEEKMGIKASDTRSITFDNVKIPAEDRLGDVGHGFK